MIIKNILMKNFRMLKNVEINLQDELTLFIGKNNSGKTSFIVLLEKFLNRETFDFNDFPIDLRPDLFLLTEKTDDEKITIRLGLEIEYGEDDNLTHISSFINDLDENKNTVNILFQAKIDKDRLLKKINKISESEKRRYFIKKNLHRYIEKDYFIYENRKMFNNLDTDDFIKKELTDIRKLINLEVIHAKRNVATSNDVKEQYKVISKLTSDYFNEKNSDDESHLDKINDLLLDVDKNLQSNYEETFKDLLNTTKSFLSETPITVESNLESESVIKHSSRVTYGLNKQERLPENYKGLGYTNLIYLVLNMEIKLLRFANDKANINIFMIEEPEAHTHPQLQSVFIQKLKENIQKWMKKENLNLQAIVTSHSSRIVDHCDFDDLRYFRVDKKEVEIKNFVKVLEAKYKEQYMEEDKGNMFTPNSAFKFIKKYIDIHTSELFFTDKVIMVEGITERVLLNYFIGKEAPILTSQNLTILEVGANAKVFYPLLEFLDVKTLIITDIDSVKRKLNKKGTPTWYKDAVENCTFTSNETLKFFYGARKEFSEEEQKKTWFEQLKNRHFCFKNKKIFVTYQSEEDNYFARSFEDAFINVNYDKFYENRKNINGLTKRDEIEHEKSNEKLFYLTENIVDKKSDIAASLLFLALSGLVEWKAPKYIKDGLKWLEQK